MIACTATLRRKRNIFCMEVFNIIWHFVSQMQVLSYVSLLWRVCSGRHNYSSLIKVPLIMAPPLFLVAFNPTVFPASKPVAERPAFEVVFCFPPNLHGVFLCWWTLLMRLRTPTSSFAQHTWVWQMHNLPQLCSSHLHKYREQWEERILCLSKRGKLPGPARFCIIHNTKGPTHLVHLLIACVAVQICHH